MQVWRVEVGKISKTWSFYGRGLEKLTKDNKQLTPGFLWPTAEILERMRALKIRI
jgi:hypothetical protein